MLKTNIFICQNRLTYKITHLECIYVTAGKEGNWPIGARRFSDVALKKKISRERAGVECLFILWLDSLLTYIFISYRNNGLTSL